MSKLGIIIKTTGAAVATTVADVIVRRSTRRRWVERARSVAQVGGVTTIVARGELATLAGLTLNIGDLWMLGAVFVWALYTIGLRWRPAAPSSSPIMRRTRACRAS